jgi:hypothetical protein
VRLLVTAAACAVLALAAACADEEESLDDPIVITVAVWPEGTDGPKQTRRIVCGELTKRATKPECRELAGLTPEDLKPVPRDTACTQIYGGPAVAFVRWGGADFRFNRTDGCQIARWDRNRVLLGD